jgi:Zn-dependent protease with chaperone function
VAASQFCAVCAQPNRPSLRFCTGCGAALAAGPPPTVAEHDSGAGAGRRAYAPIAGPVDRVSFDAEQRRHRRATRRFTSLCAVAVTLLGVPPGALVVGLAVLAVAATVGMSATGGTSASEPPTMGEIAAAAALFVVPGPLAMLVTWLGMMAVFRTAGAGRVLLTLGARPPRAGDLEERQLVNVVEEIAIAAGLPPPRVMLLDADVPNVAVVGSSRADATVVVSRRLLDDLDRDETQGVLAHLIGSAGNGDLGIIVRILAVFQALGLLLTAGDALFLSAAAGAPVVRFLCFLLGRRGPGDADLVTATLVGGVTDLSGLDRAADREGATRGLPPSIARGARLLLRLLGFTFAVALAVAVLGGLSLAGELDMLPPEARRALREALVPAIAIAGSSLVVLALSPLIALYLPGPNTSLLSSLAVCGLILTLALGIAAGLARAGLLDFLPAARRAELGEALAPAIIAASTCLGLLMLSSMVMVAWMLLRLLLIAYVWLVVQPMIALAWRTRRYLADATAVQLTRYPDGIARGLVHLAEMGGVIRGGDWAAHLFIVGPEAASERATRRRRLMGRQARAAREAFRRQPSRRAGPDLLRVWTRDPLAARVVAAGQRAQAVPRPAPANGDDRTLTGRLGFVAFHPPLWRRLLRLKALGATIAVEDWRKEARREALTTGCVILVIIAVVAAILAAVIASGGG